MAAEWEPDSRRDFEYLYVRSSGRSSFLRLHREWGGNGFVLDDFGYISNRGASGSHDHDAIRKQYLLRLIDQVDALHQQLERPAQIRVDSCRDARSSGLAAANGDAHTADDVHAFCYGLERLRNDCEADGRVLRSAESDVAGQ